MPIYAKVGTSTWSTNAKKVWVKAADGWKSGTKLFAKTIAGWVQMWPGDAPASSLADPINIRLTSFNGSVATSPQFINTVLYGNDGGITGATPITVNIRRMRISENDTGNTTRYTLETSDVYNVTNNSETDIGYKRYLADGWWLFYELIASNVWSPYPPGTTLTSPPIKIIRQAPTFTTNSPTLSEDYSSTNPFLSINFSFSDTWWKAADLSRSYVRWWQNTSKTASGTILKTTYIDDIFGLIDTRSGSYSDYNGTGTTVSGVDSYTAMGGIPAGQYIIAEVVLINSNTDHTGSPVRAFKSTGDVATITSLTVKDDNTNGVVDNQSSPRIMSDGWLNFTATVTGALSNTYYLLETRWYNNQNGTYYDYNTSTVIGSTSWPTDLTPSSVTLNGSDATVSWRTYIDADTLYGIAGPTYGTSNTASRWQLEFRVSARASSTTSNAAASYFNGIATLGTGIFLGGIDVPGMINIAPSSAMTLNADTTGVQLGSTVTFSGSTVSYPFGYASYPKRYQIDFGDGTTYPSNGGWQTFNTGTSNPSFSGITKTYSTSGTYAAVLKWEPQGDPGRSTRTRAITVSPQLSAPTSVSVTTSRSSNTEIQASLTHSGGSGPYFQMYWTTQSTAPVTAAYDSASNSSTTSISDVFSPFNNSTYYFYVRSSSQNITTTNTSGSALAGTYSAWSNISPANPSYTFLHPSGSVSISPSSGTAGTTQFTATPSISASPTATLSYQWQYFENSTIGWVSLPAPSTSSTYTPPSNYVSFYGTSLRCRVIANNGVPGSSPGFLESFTTSSDVSVSAPIRATNVARRVTMPSNFTNSSQNVWVGTNGYVSVTADPTTSPGTGWPTAGGVVVGPGVADLVQSSLSTKSDSSNFWVYWKGYRLGDAAKELWYLMKFTWNSATVDVWFERYTLTDGSDDAVRSGNTQYSTWANSTSISTFAVPTTGMVSSTTNDGVDDNRTQITATKPGLNLITNPAYGTPTRTSSGFTATISTAPNPTGGTYSISSYTSTDGVPTINSSTGAVTQPGLAAGTSATVFVNYALSGYNTVQISVTGQALSGLITVPSYGTSTSTSGGWTATISTAPNPTGGTYSVVSQTAGSASVNSSTGALTASGLSAGASSTVTVRYSLSGYNPVDRTATGTASSGTAPSGGSVTLTPSGTQQAGTLISANVTAMSGTATITYTTTIRKRTGADPTSSTDGNEVASGTGTGNAVATHTITAGEASGTPDRFRAFTTGTNATGSNTVSSNVVTSTPATVSTLPSAPGTPTLTYVSANNTSTDWGYSATWADSTSGTTPITYYLIAYGSSDGYVNGQATLGPYTTGTVARSFLLPRTSSLWQVAAYGSNTAGVGPNSTKSNTA